MFSLCVLVAIRSRFLSGWAWKAINFCRSFDMECARFDLEWARFVKRAAGRGHENHSVSVGVIDRDSWVGISRAHLAWFRLFSFSRWLVAKRFRNKVATQRKHPTSTYILRYVATAPFLISCVVFFPSYPSSSIKPSYAEINKHLFFTDFMVQ